MKKRKLLNIIMVIAIAAIIIGGVMGVGANRGWFSSSGDAALTRDVIGTVNIERSGVAYYVKDDTVLRDGDILETRSGASVSLISGSNTVFLNENTQVKILSAADSSFSAEIIYGEIFAVVDDAKGFSLIYGANTLTVNGTVFSVSMQSGSSSANVYEGEITVASENGVFSAKQGETLSTVGETSQSAALRAESLNEFNIKRAEDAGKKRDLCFTNEALEKVTEDRAEEIRLAQAEREKREAEILAQGGTEAVIGSGSSASSGASSSGGSQTNVLTCTISIRCDTILNNMQNLKDGKNKYVPSNGVILASSTVQFVEGETVFDVLKRACDYGGIQLEYSWTPMYNSYYIEGINNLYEFDCGSESGWMYKVNGWFPNYGCSSYKLKAGDVIVWCYTCNGLGADVGGSVY